MRFLQGELLWHLLWIAPLLLALMAWAWGRRNYFLAKLFGAATAEHVNLSKAARAVRFGLLLAAVLLLAVAAARPSWGVQILPSGGSGRDLLVVFDVSKSMLCKDVQPSRLEHGKWFARELVKNSHGDRFGLVAFAGTAFLECPLTSDKGSFLQALNELDVESIPVGGTNIQNALDTAMKAFKAAESGHCAIVLITDGDELSGDASKALALARETKTPLFVVGVGDPSQPAILQIPGEDGKLKTLKDSSGELVKSNLNEKALAELALGSGGIYVRSTAANTGLSEIASRISGLVPKDYDLGQQTRPIERFAYPLGLAFALFLICLCISERGVRRAAVALLAVSLLALSAQSSFADAPLPPKAEDQRSQPAPVKVAMPSNPIDAFNKAVELQTGGKDEQSAAKLYEGAINKAPPSEKELLSRSCQNLGVITHGQARAEISKAETEELKAQKLDEAVKRIDAALKTFNGAEELYCESLRNPGEAPQSLKDNQQALLLDRDAAQKLKQRIQDLKKQMEQAKKDIKQAQKQNQQQSQKQDKQQSQQDKQDQQQQSQKQDKQQEKQGQQQGSQGQDQKQDQQQQGQKQDKQQDKQGQQQGSQGQDQKQDQQQQSQGDSAQQSAKNAKDAVDKLKDSASSLSQQRLQQAAASSSKEIQRAMDSQKQGDRDTAGKHLDNALKSLEEASGDNDKDSQQQRESSKKDSKKAQSEERKDKENQSDNASGKDQDRPLEKPQKSQKPKDPNEGKGDEKEISPEQAESVLASMANDEKNLRDAIKHSQREAYGSPRVEKDW